MNEYIILDAANKKLIIEYLYSVENYHTVNIKVESKGFKGESNFCMSKEDLVSILRKLESMSKDLSGEVQIRDRDSDALINLEMENLGKLKVSGQIGGSHRDHYMYFKFESDQTILSRIMHFIKKAIK